MHLFGLSAPEGACQVRLAVKLGRVGRPTVIRCGEISEEAVQEAIDESATLAKHFRSLEDKDRRALGAKPWPLKADLTFLGSDGLEIDPAKDVELSYYGTDQEQSREAGPAALHERAMSVLQLVQASIQEQTAKACAAIVEATAKGIGEVSKAQSEGHKANASGLSEVAKQQTALVGLSEKLLAETQELKAAQMALLSQAATGGPKKEKTLGDELKDAAALVDTVKSFGSTVFGDAEKKT
jgi:hypothetical protein